ncbi:hypothetical protein OXPF_05360 [Oxobacter pfennigii]|uniref:Uncharacterized protein n=1 Tax=Oxobacter pfennigii TaxID=36849 RepID=A0A0P8WDL8_9CLOT|nr:hypothetical protein [Oxobacter pfennigii]KPU46055.1 hypothetical protein OXPF_05360 [Oxobacter pfennigii]
MRLYYHKDTEENKKPDIIITAVFIVILIIGLSICPKGTLYEVNESNIRDYSISLFLIFVSIIYFFISLALKYKDKWKSVKFIILIIFIICGIFSLVSISAGSVKLIAGSSVLFGMLMGSVLAIII